MSDSLLNPLTILLSFYSAEKYLYTHPFYIIFVISFSCPNKL